MSDFNTKQNVWVISDSDCEADELTRLGYNITGVLCRYSLFV